MFKLPVEHMLALVMYELCDYFVMYGSYVLFVVAFAEI